MKLNEADARVLLNEGLLSADLGEHEEAIENSLSSKLIITVEEHNIIGGLSSAISEAKSKFSKSPPQIVFGVNDKYSKAGEYEYLKIKHGLNAENIVITALKKLIPNEQQRNL